MGVKLTFSVPSMAFGGAPLHPWWLPFLTSRRLWGWAWRDPGLRTQSEPPRGKRPRLTENHQNLFEIQSLCQNCSALFPLPAAHRAVSHAHASPAGSRGPGRQVQLLSDRGAPSLGSWGRGGSGCSRYPLSRCCLPRPGPGRLCQTGRTLSGLPIVGNGSQWSEEEPVPISPMLRVCSAPRGHPGDPSGNSFTTLPTRGPQ